MAPNAVIRGAFSLLTRRAPLSISYTIQKAQNP